MSASNNTAVDTITQLNAARALVLKDATRYKQIIIGVTPLIHPSAALELRRWGADFLAETFGSPMLQDNIKEELAVEILPTLKGYLDNGAEDVAVLKSAVQSATSVYPLIFKHAIYHPEDAASWQAMAAIKSIIFRRMDGAPGGVKMCCIKFVVSVVQMQTPGLISDPRRPDLNEMSLALVPREHPLISAPNLEAEAFGLLDRVLNVFQEQPSDAILVSATLNCIGILARTRASLANRILNAILNFNPFKSFNEDQVLTPRMKVEAKSMERTTRAFLLNLIKRAPNHPLNARIQGYLERLQKAKLESFDETTRKRPAPSDPTEDGQQSLKKPRVGGEDEVTSAEGSQYPPLPPPPISLAQLFTLSTDPVFATFPAKNVPKELLAQIVVPLLRLIDYNQLDNAVNAVRSRYLLLSQAPPLNAGETARAATDGDESDFEPMTGSTEQVLNNLDSAPEGLEPPANVSLGPFVVPQPPPLTGSEVVEYGKIAVERVLDVSSVLDDATSVKQIKPGFNRLAASNFNRDSWMTVVSRLATRTLSGLQDGNYPNVGQEDSETNTATISFSVSESIRDSLYLYVLDDFRRRMDVAISWLNEEWYNDQVQIRSGSTPEEHYNKWALKFLDGIVPYLDAKDKILIRFLSEIPSITQELLERVKKLADDPERVGLAVNSIHYLVLYRPPVREMALDAVEDLWHNYDDARAAAAKVLTRWRPELLQQPPTPAIKNESPPPAPIKPAVAA